LDDAGGGLFAFQCGVVGADGGFVVFLIIIIIKFFVVDGDSGIGGGWGESDEDGGKPCAERGADGGSAID
jgi:hypothetical protein